MSKVLKTAAIIVGGVALIASGVGAAATLGAFGATTAGTAGAAVLATATSVAAIAGAAAGALSLAAGITARSPPASAIGSMALFERDAACPLPTFS